MPVTGAGDLIEYTPGDGVGVEVTANSNGNVALRGQGVAISGENSDVTEVSLTAAAGEGIGFVARDPDDFTGDQADYSSGDSAGRTELVFYKPVAHLPVADDWDPNSTGTQTPAVGEEAEWAASGELQLYNSADAASPYGVVFRTVADPAAPNKVAVAIYR